jgi:hypothetical protein
MKSISTLPSSRRSVGLHLASIACGLVVATVALIGASGLLQGRGSGTEPPQAPVKALRGGVMPEPDFGSVAADFAAFSQPASYPPEGAVGVDFSLPTTFAANTFYPPEGAVDADSSLPTTFAAETGR